MFNNGQTGLVRRQSGVGRLARGSGRVNFGTTASDAVILGWDASHLDMTPDVDGRDKPGHDANY